MAEAKTKVSDASVVDFLNRVADGQQREDSFRLLELMMKVTGEKPKMWGPSIVGFGSYHYKYDSGHEGDMCMAGFSPRKGNLSIYILPGFEEYAELLRLLGKHKTGKSCLYIKRLSDVDFPTLRKLVKTGWNHMKAKYKGGI